MEPNVTNRVRIRKVTYDSSLWTGPRDHAATRAVMPMRARATGMNEQGDLGRRDAGQAEAIVRIITQFFCPLDRWKVKPACSYILRVPL
jgi:hypothetical protein